MTCARLTCVAALGALGALAWGSRVHAGPAAEPRLATLVPAADARQSVALGVHGEVYEPDGQGAWLRHRASTISGLVTAAQRGDAGPIAETRDGPPFRLGDDGWTVVYLGVHAHAVLGAGPRACAAVGREVFALDGAAPARLGDAPGPVIALAASRTGVVVETAAGLARLAGATWKPIAGAPRQVAELLSDRFAIEAGPGTGGVLDLRTGKRIAWPGGERALAATATPTRVFAAMAHGDEIELVTVHGGRAAGVAVPIAAAAPIVAMAADDAGHVVLAAADGRLFVRDSTTWTSTSARDALPAARPGPPPARSR